MKKKLLSVILIILTVMSVPVFASAADYGVGYSSVYSADAGQVELSVYIENALNIESAQFYVSFDKNVFEYLGMDPVEGSGYIFDGGMILDTDHVLSGAVMFMNKCEAVNCDGDGNLQLVTYKFKPLGENYDLDDFYIKLSDLTVDGNDLSATIKAIGKQEYATDDVYMEPLLVDQNGGDTDNKTTKAASEKKESNIKIRWWVYAVIGAVAVIAVVVIAVVTVRNSNVTADDKKDKKGKKEESSEDENK